MFSKNYADVLILETGLGGRLDATNIIKNNLISIITKIGYDHQEYLGKSIKKITKEIGGQKGPEPTRYGDWEKNGRVTDF